MGADVYVYIFYYNFFIAISPFCSIFYDEESAKMVHFWQKQIFFEF